jgi:hypothetical protein
MPVAEFHTHKYEEEEIYEFPNAVENILQLPNISDEERKILWDNCAEFYKVS